MINQLITFDHKLNDSLYYVEIDIELELEHEEEQGQTLYIPLISEDIVCIDYDLNNVTISKYKGETAYFESEVICKESNLPDYNIDLLEEIENQIARNFESLKNSI